MGTDSKDFSLGLTSDDILRDLNKDLDSWTPEETKVATTNTGSTNWLDRLTKIANTAGQVAQQYGTQANVPANVSMPPPKPYPSWLVPAAIGTIGLIAFIALSKDNQKDKR